MEQWGRGGETDRGERGDARERKTERERERARKGQFDVNRSIVIRVNRLQHCSSTVPRTQSMIFVLLYFIYSPSGREKCRWLRRAASVYGRLPRETRSDIRVTDDGKRKTWTLRRDEIYLIYLKLWAYWCILNSEWEGRAYLTIARQRCWI